MKAEGKRFVVWGGKGHGAILYEIIRSRGDSVECFFDLDTTLKSPIDEVPIHLGMEAFENWMELPIRRNFDLAACVAIGGARGEDRVRYLELFRKHDLSTPSIVHKSAEVSPSAVIGEGSHLLALAHVGAKVVMDEACIMNSHSNVEHECVLGRGVHIGPSATLCGCVSVGDFCFIGAGVTVLPKITIGSRVTVGAGAVVTRDLPDGCVALGVPARVA